MNKRERVIAAIEGREVDSIPSSFSLHFPEEVAYGDAAVDAHLDFFKKTDTDILKLMNENLLPYMGEIEKAEDYKAVRFSVKDQFMVDELDLVKKVLAGCDEECFSMLTLHGITASAIHPLEKMKAAFDYDGARAHLSKLFNENHVPVVDAMKRIADGMCDLIRESMRLGIDGIYYAALGGEYRYFTDEQFATHIEPLDKMILSAIKEAGGYCFLHICKDGLNMDRYGDYGDYCDVVNWGIYEAPFSLEAGRKMFPEKTIMGGLANRSGVLVDGSPEQITEEVRKVIALTGKRRFILGADCTLATEQDLSRVHTAVQAAREV